MSLFRLPAWTDGLGLFAQGLRENPQCPSSGSTNTQRFQRHAARPPLEFHLRNISPDWESGVLSPSRVNAVWKLANAGERAGLSLELMIELLNCGMSVVALLDLITWRLDYPETSPEWVDYRSCGGA